MPERISWSCVCCTWEEVKNPNLEVSKLDHRILKFVIWGVNVAVVIIINPAGGVEEDIIKCLAYRGDFSLSCADLHSKGLNRVVSLLVPNENYLIAPPKLRTNC
ncbi:hypothetical protein L1987_08156 [Smallanthus sonchifolius]|uniref:Uncharacterized protein n=1 Tax=Smallanthus sonchifolius TaxID=185202 RepID=A0ACB9JLQ7_9ASTR|nr:hypothetical protein L1987_08156 [Smallanthus sonchifolius]